MLAARHLIEMRADIDDLIVRQNLWPRCEEVRDRIVCTLAIIWMAAEQKRVPGCEKCGKIGIVPALKKAVKTMIFCVLFILGHASGYCAQDQKELVYGELLGMDATGWLMLCKEAGLSHPTGFYAVAPSQDRVVHVRGFRAAFLEIISSVLGGGSTLKIPPAGNAKPGETFALLAQPGATFTYTNKLGRERTVPELANPEPLPAYSVITSARDPVTRATPAPTATPMPDFPMAPTLADLKIGITAEQCRRILGNPLRINGDQWVYARGYIYIRNGVVSSMQNKAGGVFAAEWK
jgi:hypothetical protein